MRLAVPFNFVWHWKMTWKTVFVHMEKLESDCNCRRPMSHTKGNSRPLNRAATHFHTVISKLMNGINNATGGLISGVDQLRTSKPGRKKNWTEERGTLCAGEMHRLGRVKKFNCSAGNTQGETINRQGRSYCTCNSIEKGCLAECSNNGLGCWSNNSSITFGNRMKLIQK